MKISVPKITRVFLLAFACFAVSCRGPLNINQGGIGVPFGGGDPAVPTNSPIKHIIVLVFQNASFDHLFGHFTPPSGQTIEAAHPGVPGFTQKDATGASISPFLLTNPASTDMGHNGANYTDSIDGGAMDGFAKTEGTQSMGYYDQTVAGVDVFYNYATQFELADHYFSSALNSAPAQMLYMVSASNNNLPFSTQPKNGPCNKKDVAAVPDNEPNVGDEMTAANVGWTWFHEDLGQCGSYVPQQNPFQYFTSTHASDHIQDLTVFTAQLANNQLPSVSFIQMSPAHSGHPGSSAITAAASWYDNMVKQIQASGIANDVAIVAFFDEGGGWYDHVPPPQLDANGLGVRVPMILVSNFAKKGTVYHGQLDHTSILKFIQWNWNLQPLNARNSDARVGDLREMFTF
jgi:phospholipase C